jgi:lipid-binding SYLF domain-containing protein
MRHSTFVNNRTFRDRAARRAAMLLSLGAAFYGPMLSGATPTNNPVTHRLDDANTVFSEIMSAPDRGIPRDLLDKAHCAVIVPGLKKGAFVFGAEYGKGFVTCRRKNGKGWSAPASVRMEGGSFGFQIGGSETDVVLLVMNDRGARRMLESQFTLGADGEVAAGPVGRQSTAQTDAKFTAEILSWSRSRGIFAGIALKGATLRQDIDDNETMYGTRLENRQIVAGAVRPTAAGRRLIGSLERISPREER